MKIINSLLLGLLLALMACQQPTSNKVTIKVQLKGGEGVSLRNKLEAKTLTVDENGLFHFESDSLAEGKYALWFGGMLMRDIYVKPGTILNMEVDYDKLVANDRNAVVIAGENIEECILLNKLELKKAIYDYASTAEYKNNHMQKVYGQLPNEFLAYQLDKLADRNDLIDQFVIDYPTVSGDFIDELKLVQILKSNYTINLYNRIAKKFMPDVEFEIPDNYSDYFVDQIPQNDFALYAKVPDYQSYVREKYYKKMGNALSSHTRESLAYYKAKIEFLDNCDFPTIIKKSMYSGLTIGYMRSKDNEIRSYLDSMIYLKVKDADALNRFEVFKAGEASFEDGGIAPQFTMQDFTGKEVSLSDFNGSMVMMDCWATWCAPCVAGLPKFNKMKEKYAGKKIVFLAVSTDVDIKAWRKEVNKFRDTHLSGYQLNSTLTENTFMKEMMVQGIPRYILIGADGRIIKREAPAPGSDELYTIIDAHLK